jgi:pimeloyl-ACP methyl ester carboxylesterase
VFIVDVLASGYLRYYGFDFHRTSLVQSLTIFPFRPLTLFTTHCSPAKTLTYWHRPHTSKTGLPILFIHGIGIGLYPYINFLVDLNAGNGEDSQLGIIAVEIMPVSFRITSEALLKDRMCEEIHRILEAHGWDKVVLVSHSWVPLSFLCLCPYC